MCKKINIKSGQIWRCKTKNYCIVVGKKVKDNNWQVHPHGNKNSSHKMNEQSFHFYELVE
jgi:hypothetical protein